MGRMGWLFSVYLLFFDNSLIIELNSLVEERCR